MKRMMCFISDWLMPSYIAVNEKATRPGSLHVLYTPSEPRMKQRWLILQSVLKQRFPSLELHGVEVENAYDGCEVQQLCFDMFEKFPDDEWTLNGTGGTKVMAAAAMDIFWRQCCDVYYVETRDKLIQRVRPDWSVDEIKFEGEIDLESYFSLYGLKAVAGKPGNKQEEKIHPLLAQLDWKLWAGVAIFKPPRPDALAEYDFIGIEGYQMSVMECKRIDSNRDDLPLIEQAIRETPLKRRLQEALIKAYKEQKREQIVQDLLKLHQVKSALGGPFSRIYWIYEGGLPLSEVNKERLKSFGITLIRGQQLEMLKTNPQSVGLPARKV